MIILALSVRFRNFQEIRYLLESLDGVICKNTIFEPLSTGQPYSLNFKLLCLTVFCTYPHRYLSHTLYLAFHVSRTL
jgi:hypothetical protein